MIFFIVLPVSDFNFVDCGKSCGRINSRSLSRSNLEGIVSVLTLQNL